MMRTIPAVCLSLATLAAGCSRQEPAQVPVQPAETAKGPLVMKMRAVHTDAGGEAPFKINDPLKNGQRIAYYVTADQDAYVYVMQFFADGSPPNVLFPPRGEQKISGGKETRVPLAGQYLELEGEPGLENVYVVATRSPLKTSDPELAGLVHEVRTSPSAEPAAAPTAPPAVASAPLAEPPAPSAAPPLTSAQAIVDKPKPPAPPPSFPRPPAANNYLALLKTRSIDLGAPCPEGSGLKCRSLKLVQGTSYEGVANENGVVVIHFAFQHVR